MNVIIALVVCAFPTPEGQPNSCHFLFTSQAPKEVCLSAREDLAGRVRQVSSEKWEEIQQVLCLPLKETS